LVVLLYVPSKNSSIRTHADGGSHIPFQPCGRFGCLYKTIFLLVVFGIVVRMQYSGLACLRLYVSIIVLNKLDHLCTLFSWDPNADVEVLHELQCCVCD
jgi:hypothetical protein